LKKVWDEVGNRVVEHGGQTKPVLVTGHSAGGALATLAADRFRRAGLNVHSAYVFASPRVGNRVFVDSYSVPLYRIETMDDLVPHVPLPPAAMAAVDFILERIAEMIRPAFPNLIPSLSTQTEYVHAGKLFFIDWDGQLVYSHTLGEFAEDFLGGLLGELFGVKRNTLPGTAIPKSVTDAARALRTTASVGPQILAGTFEFFHNHPMKHHRKWMRKLLAG